MWSKHEVSSLQYRENNLSIQKRKTSFAYFKVKQRNIFGLALIDTGSLVHSAIVSGDFCESIGGKISSPMDHWVGTVDGQSKGLQVIEVGESWLIYLEEMEDSYVLMPLVIQGLSHSVNLGMSFLQKYNLKMICTEEEFALMPVKDGLALRARLVDGGCHSFLNKRSGMVLRATKDQMILWRIPWERISVSR